MLVRLRQFQYYKKLRKIEQLEILMKFDCKKFITITLVILLYFTSSPVFSEGASEKEKDIKKLLQASGILDQLSYMQDTLMNSVSIPILFD